MVKIFVSGGFYREKGVQKDVGAEFGTAFAQIIDWESGKIEHELLYRTPEQFIDPDFGIIFKAGYVGESEILVPTSTEILSLAIPSLQVQKRISLPSFNDLHHVMVHGGNVYVANTGLEILQVLGVQGELKQEVNMAVTETWKRFSKEKDYRFVQTTKPHETHFNYVFFLGEEPWVTRLIQKDAISVVDPRRRIDLSVSEGAPHDGCVVGDSIYFTITDGYLVEVDKYTLQRKHIYNLNKICGSTVQLGWCRGIDVVDGRAFVGFTRLRTSKFKEYGSWIKHGRRPLPARIAEFDLRGCCLVKEHRISSLDSEMAASGAAIFAVCKIDLY